MTWNTGMPLLIKFLRSQCDIFFKLLVCQLWWDLCFISYITSKLLHFGAVSFNIPQRWHEKVDITLGVQLAPSMCSTLTIAADCSFCLCTRLSYFPSSSLNFFLFSVGFSLFLFLPSPPRLPSFVFFLACSFFFHLLCRDSCHYLSFFTISVLLFILHSFPHLSFTLSLHSNPFSTPPSLLSFFSFFSWCPYSPPSQTICTSNSFHIPILLIFLLHNIFLSLFFHPNLCLLPCLFIFQSLPRSVTVGGLVSVLSQVESGSFQGWDQTKIGPSDNNVCLMSACVMLVCSSLHAENQMCLRRNVAIHAHTHWVQNSTASVWFGEVKMGRGPLTPENRILTDHLSGLSNKWDFAIVVCVY